MKKEIRIGMVLAIGISGCCTHSTPMMIRTHQLGYVKRCARRDLRVPDQIHDYRVGRLPSEDCDSMRGAGHWYHIEQSAYWNRFPNGARVTMTNTNAGPRAYRYAANDQELIEQRHEAKEEKEKAFKELTEAQIAKEKLDIATAGIARTNDILREADSEIGRLKTENAELKGKMELGKNNSVKEDFSAFAQESGQTSKPGKLADGPNQ
jgi:hypothetical protein